MQKFHPVQNIQKDLDSLTYGGVGFGQEWIEISFFAILHVEYDLFWDSINLWLII